MNCLKCKSYLEFVCLDCSEEVCSTCDKKQKHLTHEKQKISCITKKCDGIKVQIDDEKKFDSVKNEICGTLEMGMKLLENISDIQQKFSKMVQDAEYHCELKRLARKYSEGVKKKEDDSSQREVILKIMTKSKKCGFNLNDSCQEKSLSLNQIHEQLYDQKKLSKQLENEIKKLQDKIDGNKLFSILDSNQQEDTEKTTIKPKQGKPIIQEDDMPSSTKKRTTRKRRGEILDNISPISKQNNYAEQQTLKINKMDNTPQTQKNAPSPLLIKKLKKNLQQLY